VRSNISGIFQSRKKIVYLIMTKLFFLTIFFASFSYYSQLDGMQLHEESELMAKLSNGAVLPLNLINRIFAQLKYLSGTDFYVFCELCAKANDREYIVQRRTANVLAQLELTDIEDGCLQYGVREVIHSAVSWRKNGIHVAISNPITRYVINGYNFLA